MLPDIRFTDYYESFEMAVQMFLEVEGENSYSPTDWIDYHKIDYLSTIIKPQRKTLLHSYIHDVYYWNMGYFLGKHESESVINSIIKVCDAYEFKDDKLLALKEKYFKYKIMNCGYTIMDDLGDHLLSLYDKTLMEKVVDDIFTVLFQNKSFLRRFNLCIADLINELEVADYPEYLEKDGVLKRCSRIPEWLKRGIVYRDKGRCQLCGKDLTEFSRINDDRNYDHIIPLELGGSNDPTNFQLTCRQCNLFKSDKNCDTKDIAMPFWSMEE